QVVISGGKAARDVALEMGKEAGAKRALTLALSVAAHSPLMASAAEQFTIELEKVDFQQPTLDVYGNVSTRPLETPDMIVAELREQIVAPVRWTESVRNMIDGGAATFVEIGVGEVLSGLVKRIDRAPKRLSVNSAESLREYLKYAV
ncbi:MAG: ACP S-malonyltransferase, partial [Chloroflexota bacterium]